MEFPRRFWNSADIEFSLTNQEIKASSDFKDIADAHFAISIEVANALKTQQSLTSSSDKEVGEAIEIIIGECPPEFRSSRAGTVAADKDGKVTIDTLGALRTQLKFFKSRYRMAQAKVESTKLEAYRLEDVINAKHRNTAGNVKFDGVQKIHWALSAESSSEWEYKWEIEYKPYYHKACAIGFGMLSMFSFIGAICSMNGVEPSNSVYFLAVNDDTATAGGIVIFIFFTLGYVVYVSFWALFQMKLAGLMDLVVGGTTPESLSFNVRMVARLAAPLVFFYLGWIAENGLNSGSWVENDAPKLATTDPNTGVVTYSDQQIFMPSAFSNFYQLQSVGIIKTTFGTVFPIILIVFTLMTVTNSYNWICVKLKLEDFQFGTPLVTEEQKREGMRQLEKTKKSTLNKARRSRFLKFLTVAHDSDSVDEPQTGGGGLFSFLLGGSKSNEDEINLNAPQTNDNQSTAEPEIVPPANLSGVVQRKSSGFLGSFKDYYLDVRAPGVLHYFANKEECDNDVLNNKMPPPVDLLTIIDFKVSGKELALQLPDETHNLKFKNEGQCDQWKNQFIEWKDFAVDHGVEYSQMMTDQLNSIDVGLESSMSPLRSATADSNTSTLNNNNNNNNNNNVFEKVGGFLVRTPHGDTSTSQSKQAPKISASSIGEDRPTSLNGFVEMKGKSLVSERWDRVYLNVDDKTGYFTVSKSAGGSQLHSMHLPMVQVSLCLSLSLEWTLGGYISILVVSCFMWSGALDSSDILLLYSTTSLA